MNVEFVSANPTGPLHVGHGRQAALGDAISSLLVADRLAGLARVLLQRRRGADREPRAQRAGARAPSSPGRPCSLPEGGYHGEYIREIAAALRRRERGRRERRRSRRGATFRRARAAQGAGPRPAGVRREVRRLLPRVVALRRRPGRRDGARGSSRRATRTRRTARSGCARPTSATTRTASCARATATFTYFVPDVAYHVTKWERGFKRAINVQGADHHSTVTRVRDRAAGARHRDPQGLSRTTCCTRW